MCETYLTSIREFSPNDPPSSHIQICIVQNNRGTLTTQLQSDRSQMFRRSFTDDFTNVSRTSVENMIELKFEELGGLVDCTGYTDVGLRVEVFGEESCDQSGTGWGLLSGLNGRRWLEKEKSQFEWQVESEE